MVTWEKSEDVILRHDDTKNVTGSDMVQIVWVDDVNRGHVRNIFDSSYGTLLVLHPIYSFARASLGDESAIFLRVSIFKQMKNANTLGL